MDWLKDTVRRSHAVIVAAKHSSTRNHLKSQLERLARRLHYTLQIVEPSEDSIGIDEVRRLYRSTGYRRRGQESSIVVISEAQAMTLPAQNAFLKLLEEPPQGVKFVLLCPDPQSLIITIRSRCQILHWRPKPLSEFKAEFPGLDETQQMSLYYASGGDVIEARALLEQPEGGMNAARALLTKPLGEAVLSIAEAASTRQTASAAVESLTKLAHAALRHADSDDKKRQWLNRLEAGLEARAQLAVQANSKMVIDNLILEFRAV
jgi:DNA polymerase III delta prime subunit